MIQVPSYGMRPMRVRLKGSLRIALALSCRGPFLALSCRGLCIVTGFDWNTTRPFQGIYKVSSIGALLIRVFGADTTE